MRTRWHNIAVLGFVLLAASCSQRAAQSGFRCIRADRRITGQSDYPIAVDPDLVGTYPADTKSGAGYFYDQVLEYRVWLHPDKGAANVNGNKDYFVAFAQYEPAEVFSKATLGAEQPIVLVRQFQWVDEPERGHFVPEKGRRITEWQVQWLPGNKRTQSSIRDFLKHPKEAGP